MFARRDKKNGDDTAHQAAPENESGAAEKGGHISHQNCVVDLAAEQPANNGCEDQIRDRRRIVTSAPEFVLCDDLRDDESGEYRDAKAGKLESADVICKRVLRNRGVDVDHAWPGRGAAACAACSSDARSP